MNLRYLAAGGALTGILVGWVWLVRAGQPQLPTGVANFARAQGPADAPIQIIEYSDFQCPACGKAQPEIYKLLGQYPGKIRLVFQHFPLGGHRWAPLAHRAAECAAKRGQFWLYQDQLYAGQSSWVDSREVPLETFFRYAKNAGIDLDIFGRCMSDQTVDKIIREEQTAGSGLGVRSTPSFFVNGNMVVGTARLREAVEKALSS